MKKLVNLDPISKCHTEIDKVKLERLSKELLYFIKTNVGKNDDIYGIWKNIVPLCEKIFKHTLNLPLPYSELPLKHAVREGLLSEDFEELYSAFSNAITGTATKITDDMEINGELYTYVDFENLP